MNGLSQFKAEWNHTLLAPLAVQRHQQVIKVDVGEAQLEHFANACPGVKQEEQNQVEPPLKSAFRLPLHQRADLLLADRGQEIFRGSFSCAILAACRRDRISHPARRSPNARKR